MTNSKRNTPFEEQTGLDSPSPWPELLDELLRGMGHALSNRIGALMALAHLEPHELPQAQRIQLSSEIERLLELNRLLRLLPADPSNRLEALLPANVLTDALAIMALHPLARELSWHTRVENTQPVRVSRSALLRSLLSLLEGSRAAAERAGARAVTLTLGGDDAILVISTHTDGAPAGPPIRLPTLRELRRRESQSLLER